MSLVKHQDQGIKERNVCVFFELRGADPILGLAPFFVSGTIKKIYNIIL